MADANVERRARPDLYAYLLVRNDLPSLGRGKAYAHSMHAGNHMTWQLAVMPLMRNEPIRDDVTRWHDQGGGFGTTAAIGNRGQIDLATLEAVTEAARTLGHQAGIVVDTSYPYEVDVEIYGLLNQTIHTQPADRTADGYRCYRRETTAGWIFGEKKALGVLLKRFGLVPND